MDEDTKGSKAPTLTDLINIRFCILIFYINLLTVLIEFSSLNKVLINRPNTTYISSTIVIYYTLQHVSAVHISHHQEDVGYTERNIEGERGLSLQSYELLHYYSKNGIIRLKLIHTHAPDSLGILYTEP